MHNSILEANGKINSRPRKMSREDTAADSTIKLDNLAPQILDQHFENIIARTNIGSGSAKSIEEFIQNQIQNKGPKVPTEVVQQLGTILKSQSLDVANAIRNEAIKTGLYQSIGAESRRETDQRSHHQIQPTCRLHL
jgi:hypothetical protein